MARMTNAQLIDENIRLRAQCDALEQRLASKPAAKPLVRRTPYVAHALPAHMAAARELAMRTGACVKV